MPVLMAHRFVALLGLAFLACGDRAGGVTKDAPVSRSDGTIGTPDDTMPIGDGGGADGSTTGGDAGAPFTCGIPGGELCTSAQECCVSSGGAHKCVALGTCSDAAFARTNQNGCNMGEVCCGFGPGGDGSAGSIGPSVCVPEADCHFGQGITQVCYSDADCVMIPNAPMCCPVPTYWLMDCRAHCGH